MIDVNIVYYDLKVSSSDEVVRYNSEDDTYTIVLNSRQASNRLRKAYLHAMRHIRNGDFKKNSVQNIESNTHEEV